MPTEAAVAWQRRQSQIARGAGVSVARIFAQVDPDRIKESWAELLPQAQRVWAAAQLAAAGGAAAYVAASIEEQGGTSAPMAVVPPSSFVVADAAMLAVPAFAALRRIARGARPAEAVVASANSAGLMTRTRTAFAGTDAAQMATLLEPDPVGYIRVLHLPSCGRCAILAGRIYSTSESFNRHPGCDCTNEPVLGGWNAEKEQLDPQVYFDSLSEREQNRRFGRTEADAIRGGASPAKAVNTKRDLYNADMSAMRREARRAADKTLRDNGWSKLSLYKRLDALRDPRLKLTREQMRERLDELLREAGYL